METHSPNPFQNPLREKLVESLTAPIPEGTPRRIYGAVRFPGKIYAVVGVRRAGKTMFVHQIQFERLAEGWVRVFCGVALTGDCNSPEGAGMEAGSAPFQFGGSPAAQQLYLVGGQRGRDALDRMML